MSARSAKSLLLGAFVWAISLSYGYSDWNIYKRNVLAHPGGWKLYLSGGIDAPWQYRIGPWIVVNWMNRWFHWRPYDTLALLDVLCLALALWIVLRTLRRSGRYRALPFPMRWLPLAGTLFLAEYYLAWGHWYQTSVTVPSILFVVLSMALMGGEMVRSRTAAGLLLVSLAWVQGFIRADVAVVLHAGILLAILFDRKATPPRGRVWQALISLMTAAVAGCVQLYLMLVRFPHAHYDSGGVFRLFTNLRPGMWLTMLLGLFPYFLLLALVATKHNLPKGPERLLLTASLLYLAVWATVGLVDEVRIFLPFAFALAPATAMAFTGLAAERSDSSSLANPY